MVYSTPQMPSEKRKKIRVPDILDLKNKRKISSLTCYDSSFARILELTSVDVVLVGDSLGNVIQGGNSTLGVQLDHMIYHTKCVAAALRTPLLVTDMPFGAVGESVEKTFSNAIELVRAGAEAVKIEGATPQTLEAIARLVSHGVPVMGHLGLQPQSVHAIGGHKIQGKNDAHKKRLLEEALSLEKAGCFSIVLELVEPATATAVSKALKIPTIGIGAGKGCDGQILVLQDMLGMNKNFSPKFLKKFADLETTISKAVDDYCQEVKEEKYPDV